MKKRQRDRLRRDVIELVEKVEQYLGAEMEKLSELWGAEEDATLATFHHECRRQLKVWAKKFLSNPWAGETTAPKRRSKKRGWKKRGK